MRARSPFAPFCETRLDFILDVSQVSNARAPARSVFDFVEDRKNDSAWNPSIMPTLDKRAIARRQVEAGAAYHDELIRDRLRVMVPA
jgi:hypothetical protein